MTYYDTPHPMDDETARTQTRLYRTAVEEYAEAIASGKMLNPNSGEYQRAQAAAVAVAEASGLTAGEDIKAVYQAIHNGALAVLTAYVEGHTLSEPDAWLDGEAADVVHYVPLQADPKELDWR